VLPGGLVLPIKADNFNVMHLQELGKKLTKRLVK
jgi:hypothetical protein